MNKTLFIIIAFIFILGCSTDAGTKKLNTFLQTFSVDIKNYKIVCFVPADGCHSCIDPTINYYCKKNDRKFLIILSSSYKKSIDFIIETMKINTSGIITDDKNLAAKNQLVKTSIAPYFYFLEDGHVIKEYDVQTTFDKTSILKEVDKYLVK
jgi:hypothetical protein